MNSRQRILAAIHHQPVDHLPTDLWATQEVLDRLYQHFGIDDRIGLYDRLGVDGIFGVAPAYTGATDARVPLPSGVDWVDEWGMGYHRQPYATGVYDEQVYFPLAQAETIADLERYPWPSPEDYDYASLPAQARRYPGRAIECGYTAIFYWHNRLRGLENSLVDPLLRPEFTHHLIQRLSDFFTEYHRRCFEAVRGLADLTQVTDDFGSQSGLLISPRIFEAFYRQPIQRAIDLAHAYGLSVFHHDDGDLRRLLPRLVEMGIQVLNPIQWRCGGWDLEALKRDYGAKLCFHGGVDNQETLPFRTEPEVRAEVRRLKQTLGSGDTGYILAPCHNLQANTLVENIIAMYDEAIN